MTRHMCLLGTTLLMNFSSIWQVFCQSDAIKYLTGCRRVWRVWCVASYVVKHRYVGCHAPVIMLSHRRPLWLVFDICRSFPVHTTTSSQHRQNIWHSWLQRLQRPRYHFPSLAVSSKIDLRQRILRGYWEESRIMPVSIRQPRCCWCADGPGDGGWWDVDHYHCSRWGRRCYWRLLHIECR